MDSTNPERGGSPGKIFVGGLHRDTHIDTFTKHFGKYGEITDYVIMKDKRTQQSRGFGFIKYADPSVIDTVIKESHIINGKPVEIKRTIPKGSVQTKDFKTKKIFVGGLSTTITEDEFRNFFSKHGKVVEHQIIRDRTTNRSRGFGFVVFDDEQVVDDLLSDGNKIDMMGTQVEIKKAEPKKAANPPPAAPAPAFGRGSGVPSIGDSFGGFGDALGGFGSSELSTLPFRGPGGIGGGRLGGYSGYGDSSEFSGGFGNFGSSGLGGYRGEYPHGSYSSRFGSYGSGGFGGGYGGSGLGGYGRGVEGYGNYGSGFSGSLESGPGQSYGGAGGLYGNRSGFSGSSRYHPYSR